MSKSTNYQNKLIAQVEKIIDTLTVKNHIVYQVTTHIDRLCATGEGTEVLEHFLMVYKSHKRKYRRDKYLKRLYYWNNNILDANKIEYQYYSKCNRHREWNKVQTVRFNDKKSN